LMIGLDEKGRICRVHFVKKATAASIVKLWKREWPLTEFKSGAKLTNWQKKPILMVGTQFQQSIWKIMAKIPKGSVTTYGEIARYIGKVGGARAVGSACGANPVPFIVPCHRVIAANGGMGGFSGGLDVKIKLLKNEGYLKSARK
jgi:methylated-DNA-[protein]-cysteine S-methyltransferase